MSIALSIDETARSPEVDWRALADELARALEETMLRNPNLTSRNWDRGHGALQRYDSASAADAQGSAAVPHVS